MWPPDDQGRRWHNIAGESVRLALGGFHLRRKVDLLPANLHQKQEQHGRDPLQDWWPSYKVWLEGHLEFIAVTPGATDKLSCSTFWGDRRENLVLKESRRKKIHQLDIQQPCSEINYTDETFYVFLCVFEIYTRPYKECSPWQNLIRMVSLLNLKDK